MPGDLSITPTATKRIVTPRQLTNSTGAKRSRAAAAASSSTRTRPPVPCPRRQYSKTDTDTPSRTPGRVTGSPNPPWRVCQRRHCAAFRGSPCRPTPSLLDEGIFDHRPRSVQRWQEWLWCALTSTFPRSASFPSQPPPFLGGGYVKTLFSGMDQEAEMKSISLQRTNQHRVRTARRWPRGGLLSQRSSVRAV